VLGIVFAGRPARHDRVHTARDHELDKLCQHVVVDGAVRIEWRGDDVDDAFKVRDLHPSLLNRRSAQPR
jgi:hypothetical protein